MKTELFKANTRGHKNYGWLDTHHTFSFADYYNPQRIHFGALRVVNDDIVAESEGFGTHPHDNMEIVSIPLIGALEHKDSMGNGSIIRSGEVQVMSAGTGVTHSEFNPNYDEKVNFFQIWVFPNKRNVEPRYGQQRFDFLSNKNHLTTIVSPQHQEQGLWLHQDTWFNIGIYDNNQVFEYKINKQGNGVFIMVIEGKFDIAQENLMRRDAISITETEIVKIESKSDNAWILLIEVPMLTLDY
jgi:redox-sensitive bicupin YhaK (pirin superfamily)